MCIKFHESRKLDGHKGNFTSFLRWLLKNLTNKSMKGFIWRCSIAFNRRRAPTVKDDEGL
ncbi:hypothetical protein Hdeb2414_s0027g00688081 [Helianthus debilis subsp. tardiflorus]